MQAGRHGPPSRVERESGRTGVATLSYPTQVRPLEGRWDAQTRRTSKDIKETVNVEAPPPPQDRQQEAQSPPRPPQAIVRSGRGKGARSGRPCPAVCSSSFELL